MSTSSNPVDIPVSAAGMSMPPVNATVRADTLALISRLGVAEQFPAAMALTQELFGEFTIEVSDDPEICNYSYVTFKVRERGGYDSAFQKESEWIQRLPRCPTQAPGSFCISVDVVE